MRGLFDYAGSFVHTHRAGKTNPTNKRTGGKVITRFGSGDTAFVTSLSIQSNGDLIAVGVDGGAVAVARYQ